MSAHRQDPLQDAYGSPAPGNPGIDSASSDGPRPRLVGSTDGDGSIAQLIKHLRDDALILFKQEAALVRTEVTEKARRAAADAARVPAGALVAYLGVAFLLTSLCLLGAWGLMEADMQALPAHIISFAAVGAIVALLGYAVARRGMSRLADEDMTPHQTIESMRENAQWVKEKSL